MPLHRFRQEQDTLRRGFIEVPRPLGSEFTRQPSSQYGDHFVSRIVASRQTMNLRVPFYSINGVVRDNAGETLCFSFLCADIIADDGASKGEPTVNDMLTDSNPVPGENPRIPGDEFTWKDWLATVQYLVIGSMGSLLAIMVGLRDLRAGEWESALVAFFGGCMLATVALFCGWAIGSRLAPPDEDQS